ncbi:C2 domain-containing protein [Catenaria anguillulae PL171]|uniref:C2 domain-containing protein n=1 Tax=Catenaria anguillulae PL171 TaxID=765915 RepID=A0A1Y2HDH5_9FUNG|nr:C2 domain-containing protein [Catenaria anguillulae PL171]
MPSILKIRVSCARDLPVMDRASELADAYAEIRFGDLDPQRSPIARKTLNPVWNHDFRLEIADDSVLQSEPLEIRVLDYDAITANDAVGSVLIDLDPLLGLDSSTGGGGAGAGMSAAGISGVGAGGLAGSATATAPSGMTPGGGSSEIRGWFPLYDTLRGIRGEVYVTVRLQFFGNANPFKDSSAGVQFSLPRKSHLATSSPHCRALSTPCSLTTTPNTIGPTRSEHREPPTNPGKSFCAACHASSAGSWAKRRSSSAPTPLSAISSALTWRMKRKTLWHVPLEPHVW